MKLHTKLILSLLAGVLVVVSTGQFFQYHRNTSHLAQFAAENAANQKERELVAVHNVFELVSNSVAGSLERGEMEKFTQILEQQRNIEGLEEFSLFSRDGVVTHSSHEEFIGETIDPELEQLLKEEPEAFRERIQKPILSEEWIEVYEADMITPDCIRCHQDWIAGKVGGVLHLRFSAAALTDAQVKAEEAVAQARTSAMSNTAIVTTAIVLVLVILMVIFVRRFVTRPLTLFIGALEQFEKNEGDLTCRIPIHSKDEIGRLAYLFNGFMENLNRVIASSKEAAQAVGDSTTEQSGTVNEVSGAISNMAQAIKLNADNARETLGIMQSVSQNMEEGRESMERLNGSMGELTQASRQIGQIVQTINEIAFQTNLLALNAAVEAARAGEAGRGFAVVAEEVRNLAQRSAQAAGDTGKMIERTVTEIRENSQLVDRTSAVFSAVEEHSGRARLLMDNNTKEAGELAEEIANVEESLRDMTRHTQQNTEKAGELARMMAAFKTEQQTSTRLASQRKVVRRALPSEKPSR